ncbi:MULTISPECIES: FAD-binding oxidoreductase [Weeksella]|uniref:NAD(P)/FAD-dependent oxidoreductase n=1 Tax=Weeksella TaxID=1013 RepID=UPI0008A4F114|nr:MULTISPECIES: FAD-dependent oxidoreductase [Weeksella]OFM82335.1 oxidoreductase [Weeksella sp. HMSC059D05]SUP54971.1 Gamma-glutamylputrescine oxidoreductase [Weeksella virosa]
MDLHSGLSFWIVKNELFDYFHPLEDDYSIDVAIIGSGITGALVAHELCEAGIECVIIDKRTLVTGSSAASTAQLQYEIDIPLCKLVEKVTEKRAIDAYHNCLQSIKDLENVFKSNNIQTDFLNVPTVFLASTKQDIKLLEDEYAMRTKVGLPINFLDSNELKLYQNIDGFAALQNNTSAQMDAYKGAIKLLKHHQKKHSLQIFTHTKIDKIMETNDGCELFTSKGKKIKCKYVIVAAGFEAGEFLPKKVMNLISTYVIISSPMPEKNIWPHRSLIWETADPYLYMRTTKDNRLIVGGEDEDFQNPVKRDDLLREKIKTLEQKFKKLYPTIEFKTEMAWCGTFSSTEDGLPFMGPWKKNSRILYALGYGGNGITFSMIAAQVLKNSILNKKDDRMITFGFSRILDCKKNKIN